MALFLAFSLFSARLAATLPLLANLPLSVFINFSWKRCLLVFLGASVFVGVLETVVVVLFTAGVTLDSVFTGVDFLTVLLAVLTTLFVISGCFGPLNSLIRVPGTTFFFATFLTGFFLLVSFLTPSVTLASPRY